MNAYSLGSRILNRKETMESAGPIPKLFITQEERALKMLLSASLDQLGKDRMLEIVNLVIKEKENG